MKINSEFLDSIFECALSDFFKAELSSILDDVAERNLCGRLAIHLERHMAEKGLSGYYADTEYNRKQGGLVKTILSGNMEIIPITCDLIVHSRGEILQQDNLIAIEMAKPNKVFQDFKADRKRLMALTKSSYDDIWSFDGSALPEHVCGYVKGAYLIIDRRKREATLESYTQGYFLAPSRVIKF